MPHYAIGLARTGDLPRLPLIELAAAQLLRGHAPESVLNETTSPRARRPKIHRSIFLEKALQ